MKTCVCRCPTCGHLFDGFGLICPGVYTINCTNYYPYIEDDRLCFYKEFQHDFNYQLTINFD